MLVAGMVLSIPASLLAAFAPSDTVLFVARVVGGLSAGMAYPTTLALIAALWSGPGRTKSIALWSAVGGGIAALGPLISGFLLEYFDWGSVFFINVPIIIADDVEAAANFYRPALALYIGGMGAREVNFHANLFSRMGYGDEVEEIQDLFRAGRKDEAIRRVPLAERASLPSRS